MRKGPSAFPTRASMTRDRALRTPHRKFSTSMRLLPALFTSENSSDLPSGDSAMPYHHGFRRSTILVRVPVANSTKSIEVFVRSVAHGQEIETMVGDDEIERITQSIGNTLLCAAFDWHTPDRTSR